MKKIILLASGIFVILVCILVFTLENRNNYVLDVHEINYSQIKVFDPVYIALDQGYFDDVGVTVNLVGETFGGPQALMASASGDVDSGIAATTAIINARNSGIKVKGILDVQTAFADSPLMNWYVLEDSHLQNPQDLINKKIGVNTLGASFHYTTIAYLEASGLSVSDVEFIVVPHGNLEQALRSNQIDVAAMIDPFDQIALDRGGIRSLFNAHQVIGENQFSLIFMSEEKMESDPEAVRRFTRAYRLAVEFINENPNEASEIMARTFGIDKKFIPKHKFQPDAIVDEVSINFWLSFMKSQGIKGVELLSAKEIGSNEFNVQ